MSVICYPQPGKAISRDILAAFATGCGGTIADPGDYELLKPAAFYGTMAGIDRLVNWAIASRQEFYFGDNAYFDASRGRMYRFSREELQISRTVPADMARWRRLRLEIQPWRRDGGHVVVVEQSEHHLRLSGAGASWLDRTLETLAPVTDRPIRVRAWSRDKLGRAASLREDLAGAWALVTHTSAAANEALLAGVPVFVTGACAATPLSSGPLSGIESPRLPDGREEWAAGLAGAQWTIEEIRGGAAWRWLMEIYR